MSKVELITVSAYLFLLALIMIRLSFRINSWSLPDIEKGYGVKEKEKKEQEFYSFLILFLILIPVVTIGFLIKKYLNNG